MCSKFHSNLILGATVVAVYVKDYHPFNTIPSTSCRVLLTSFDSTRCVKCSEYRKTLNVMLKRHTNRETRILSARRTDPESRTNYRFLTTPEKKQHLRRLRLRNKVCQQRIKRISEKLDQVVEENGIEVDSTLHQDLVTTMDENQAQVFNHYPPGSFQQIFWEHQHKASKLKSSKSMKWEPAMIR